MQLSDIKQLGKLIDMCRKKGVDTIKIDNMEIKLRLDAYEETKHHAIDNSEIKTENQYTDEETLFWSSAGIPDPQKSDNN